MGVNWGRLKWLSRMELGKQNGEPTAKDLNLIEKFHGILVSFGIANK